MRAHGMLLASLAFAVAQGSIEHAVAQAYPTRPITMVVPFPAGGPLDVVGRTIAERMKASLGQPVIIENIAGANGAVGTARVARAAPDGYVLGLGAWNTHVANAAVYALQYDVLNDFEPVSLLVSFASVIMSKKTIQANELRELINWLKANPRRALQGSAGIGSMGHVIGVYFQNITGTQFQHVPYRGSAPAMQDLVAGQIDLMIDTPVMGLPQLRAGHIKVYAVTARKRLDAAPDVPTVDEAGLPGFYTANWDGLWVPKGTPRAVIDKLNAAAVSTLADPTVRQKLADQGFEVPPLEEQTPEALRAFHKVEIAKWWPIIKAAGIKAE